MVVAGESSFLFSKIKKKRSKEKISATVRALLRLKDRLKAGNAPLRDLNDPAFFTPFLKPTLYGGSLKADSFNAMGCGMFTPLLKIGL